VLRVGGGVGDRAAQKERVDGADTQPALAHHAQRPRQFCRLQVTDILAPQLVQLDCVEAPLFRHVQRVGEVLIYLVGEYAESKH